MAEGLSSSERARLESGLPDLTGIGPHACVPFTVRKLAGAAVLWSNERWFLERGFDLQHNTVRERVERWLLDEFAFIVRDPRYDDSSFLEESKEVGADRYGTSEGNATHGGSGRAGVFGRFHVKGVGPTPLVGRGTEWIHAHGAAGLEEALAEAVFGEIVDAEFPFGGLPVVAIIDTGLPQLMPSGVSANPSRRALIVRPGVLRPAHFERAPYFIESLGGYLNDASDDARRVRDAITYFRGLSGDAREALRLPGDIYGWASRMGEQAAFGDAHRLFTGGMFSSNLTLHGALIDYGIMSAMPSWKRVKIHAHTPGFGADLRVLRSVCQSLSFYLNKHRGGDRAIVSSDQLFGHVELAYADRLLAELSGFFGKVSEDEPSTLRGIGTVLVQYFLGQQRQTIRFDWRNPLRPDATWLGGVISGTPPEKDPADGEKALLDAIESLLVAGVQTSGGLERVRFGRACARRLMGPRALTREAIREALSVAAIPDEARARPDPAEAAVAVRALIARGRRLWKNLPTQLEVCAQTHIGGSTALWCKRYPDGQHVVWLEGVYDEEVGHHLFGVTWALGELQPEEIHLTDRTWSTLIAVDACASAAGHGAVLTLHGRTIALPAVQHDYV